RSAVLLSRDGGVRPGRSGRARRVLGRSAGCAPVEHQDADRLASRRRRLLVTGAGGQLGHALVEAFSGDEVIALGHSHRDVAIPPPRLPRLELVVHAAAWTDVDAAEADPQHAAAVNVGGVTHAASLGVPLVVFSTDYVFDGHKRDPYVESDTPAPLSVYGRSKLHGEAAAGEDAWIVRSSWLFGPTGHNFVRTMLRLGVEREEVAVVDDQRGCPTYVSHLAAAVRDLVDGQHSSGIWHLTAAGDCTWAEFAEAIFEEAGIDCSVRRIATAELE